MRRENNGNFGDDRRDLCMDVDRFNNERWRERVTCNTMSLVGYL